MNDDSLKDEFSPLLDGELTPEKQEAVERRLANDAEALRDLDALRRVDLLYRGLTRHEAPEDLEERIRKAIRPKSIIQFQPRVERRRLWPLLAACGVFLVALGALMVQLAQVRPAQPLNVALVDMTSQEKAQPEPVRQIAASSTPSEAKLEALEGGAGGDALAPEEPATEHEAKRITSSAQLIERDLSAGRRGRGLPQDEESGGSSASESATKENSQAAARIDGGLVNIQVGGRITLRDQLEPAAAPAPAPADEVKWMASEPPPSPTLSPAPREELAADNGTITGAERPSEEATGTADLKREESQREAEPAAGIEMDLAATANERHVDFERMPNKERKETDIGGAPADDRIETASPQAEGAPLPAEPLTEDLPVLGYIGSGERPKRKAGVPGEDSLVMAAPQTSPSSNADGVAPVGDIPLLAGISADGQEEARYSRSAARGVSGLLAGGAEQQTVGNDWVFVLDKGVWRQQEYQGEEAKTVPREGEAFEALLKEAPLLATLAQWPEAVIFRIDQAWYRFLPRNVPPAPEESSPRSKSEPGP